MQGLTQLYQSTIPSRGLKLAQSPQTTLRLGRQFSSHYKGAIKINTDMVIETSTERLRIQDLSSVYCLGSSGSSNNNSSKDLELSFARQNKHSCNWPSLIKIERRGGNVRSLWLPGKLLLTHENLLVYPELLNHNSLPEIIIPIRNIRALRSKHLSGDEEGKLDLDEKVGMESSGPNDEASDNQVAGGRKQISVPARDDYNLFSSNNQSDPDCFELIEINGTVHFMRFDEDQELICSGADVSTVIRGLQEALMRYELVSTNASINGRETLAMLRLGIECYSQGIDPQTSGNQDNNNNNNNNANNLINPSNNNNGKKEGDESPSTVPDEIGIGPLFELNVLRSSFEIEAFYERIKARLLHFSKFYQLHCGGASKEDPASLPLHQAHDLLPQGLSACTDLIVNGGTSSFLHKTAEFFQFILLLISPTPIPSLSPIASPVDDEGARQSSAGLRTGGVRKSIYLAERLERQILRRMVWNFLSLDGSDITSTLSNADLYSTVAPEFPLLSPIFQSNYDWLQDKLLHYTHLMYKLEAAEASANNTSSEEDQTPLSGVSFPDEKLVYFQHFEHINQSGEDVNVGAPANPSGRSVIGFRLLLTVTIPSGGEFPEDDPITSFCNLRLFYQKIHVDSSKGGGYVLLARARVQGLIRHIQFSPDGKFFSITSMVPVDCTTDSNFVVDSGMSVGPRLEIMGAYSTPNLVRVKVQAWGIFFRYHHHSSLSTNSWDNSSIFSSSKHFMSGTSATETTGTAANGKSPSSRGPSNRIQLVKLMDLTGHEQIISSKVCPSFFSAKSDVTNRTHSFTSFSSSSSSNSNNNNGNTNSANNNNNVGKRNASVANQITNSGSHQYNLLMMTSMLATKKFVNPSNVHVLMAFILDPQTIVIWNVLERSMVGYHRIHERNLSTTPGTGESKLTYGGSASVTSSGVLDATMLATNYHHLLGGASSNPGNSGPNDHFQTISNHMFNRIGGFSKVQFHPDTTAPLVVTCHNINGISFFNYLENVTLLTVRMEGVLDFSMDLWPGDEAFTYGLQQVNPVGSVARIFTANDSDNNNNNGGGGSGNNNGTPAPSRSSRFSAMTTGGSSKRASSIASDSSTAAASSSVTLSSLIFNFHNKNLNSAARDAFIQENLTLLHSLDALVNYEIIQLAVTCQKPGLSNTTVSFHNFPNPLLINQFNAAAASTGSVRDSSTPESLGLSLSSGSMTMANVLGMINCFNVFEPTIWPPSVDEHGIPESWQSRRNAGVFLGTPNSIVVTPYGQAYLTRNKWSSAAVLQNHEIGSGRDSLALGAMSSSASGIIGGSAGSSSASKKGTSIIPNTAKQLQTLVIANGCNPSLAKSGSIPILQSLCNSNYVGINLNGGSGLYVLGPSEHQSGAGDVSALGGSGNSSMGTNSAAFFNNGGGADSLATGGLLQVGSLAGLLQQSGKLKAIDRYVFSQLGIDRVKSGSSSTNRASKDDLIDAAAKNQANSGGAGGGGVTSPDGRIVLGKSSGNGISFLARKRFPQISYSGSAGSASGSRKTTMMAPGIHTNNTNSQGDNDDLFVLGAFSNDPLILNQKNRAMKPVVVIPKLDISFLNLLHLEKSCFFPPCTLESSGSGGANNGDNMAAAYGGGGSSSINNSSIVVLPGAIGVCDAGFSEDQRWCWTFSRMERTFRVYRNGDGAFEGETMLDDVSLESDWKPVLKVSSSDRSSGEQPRSFRSSGGGGANNLQKFKVILMDGTGNIVERFISRGRDEKVLEASRKASLLTTNYGMNLVSSIIGSSGNGINGNNGGLNTPLDNSSFPSISGFLHFWDNHFVFSGSLGHVLKPLLSSLHGHLTSCQEHLITAQDQSDLFAAVEMSDLAGVMAVFSRNPTLNPNFLGLHQPLPPLTVAARLGNIEIVEALIKRGAMVNVQSAAFFTPEDYQNIILSNDEKNNGSGVDNNNGPGNALKKIGVRSSELVSINNFSLAKNGLLPIHAVCFNGSLPCLKLLAKSMAFRPDVRYDLPARDARLLVPHYPFEEPTRFVYPLHIAAYHGHTDLVMALLQEYNADPNVLDSNGKTPLHYACMMYDRHKALGLIEALIIYGCDVNVVAPRSGSTALHHLVFNDHALDAVVYLLRAGARPDLYRDVYGDTAIDLNPLIFATEKVSDYWDGMGKGTFEYIQYSLLKL